jgi:hypothetical protein
MFFSKPLKIRIEGTIIVTQERTATEEIRSVLEHIGITRIIRYLYGGLLFLFLAILIDRIWI